jgi:CheY-like chemotaxis protein
MLPADVVSSSVSTSSIRILVADDDEAMRSLLGASLRREGFEVRECVDGGELLAELEAARNGDSAPDLVVSDLRMPGVNGLDVLHWLRRWLPEVPVILITAFGDRQVHKRAEALGAVMVIDKPFDLGEFLEHVRETSKRYPVGVHD